MDTRIISLDIETYGAVEEGTRGNLLPQQTVFHPARSMHTDNVDLIDLIISASITLVKEDQCQNNLYTTQSKPQEGSMTTTQGSLQKSLSVLEEPSCVSLKNLSPQETMTFNMSQKEDRERLRRWLQHSTHIIGMNLPFDIQYLRKDPYFKFVLTEQKLIDLSIINYLHDETRPEKSLKNLGPILRTHSYTNTLKEQRFKSINDPLLYEYNAQDTHNTVLAVRELARRIERDFPGTDKLSTFCLNFYSDLLWTIIRMSETGICMDAPVLSKIEESLLEQCKIANEKAEEMGYPLEGEGSGKAKQQLMDDAIDLIGDWIRDEMELTPAKGLVSFTEANRNKLQNELKVQSAVSNIDNELIEVFDAAKTHAGAQKIISSYTFPLLRYRRNKPTDKSSCLIPSRGRHIAYPTWYATPTYAKNDAGGSGGTLQGRITCKKPSAQTFPPTIKECICSRFKEGKIVSMDLSQIELRVAGLLSGDPAFIDAYNNNADLHTDRALQVFGGTTCTHDQRQVGKMVNFADLFRAGPDVIRKQVLGMSGTELDVNFCKEIVKNRKHHRPKLWDFQERLIKTASSKGRVEIPFTGQSRYFMGGDKYEVNEIVNFPVQTTASNVLVSIQSYIHKSMASLNVPKSKIHMFLNIYDAIYFDVKDDETEKELVDLVEDAVDYVQDEGYWSMISEYYGNSIPLIYDWS
tara:strand:- start:2446 stop:4518 length:2073 start_codon:yes stop_codon:yes gene_type:complete